MTTLRTIADITSLFDKWGHDAYTERVSSLAHAVQCAELAESAGSSSALVIAALLHDVGHLADLESSDGAHEVDADLEHEATGARMLASLFPPAVTGPVALHVAAKRYLCAVDRAYADTLSETSQRTLTLQGGMMSPDEARRFERLRHWNEAVSLRRWDDLAKDPENTHDLATRFNRILDEHHGQISR